VPKLYQELAEWWHLFSPPEEYAGETRVFTELFQKQDPTLKTMLELGSGGGNNASFMKEHFDLTLTDASDDMLNVSRRLNPECRHINGDMRSMRLDETFDAVFVHDAIMYMTTEDDLRQVLETAFAHCKDNGVALFAPDWVLETFKPGTDDDAHDGEGRSIRWLEWTHDIDSKTCLYKVDYAILLKSEDGEVKAVHDQHVESAFPEETWLNLLSAVGFKAEVVQDPLVTYRRLFVARRQAS
jgi:trans-aconitate methyltransferase